MLGLVSKGQQNFVEDLRGRETWVEICAGLGVDDPDYEALIEYQPGETTALIVACATTFRQTPDELLEDFGTYVTAHANGGALRRILRFGGEDYLGFLRSLPEIPRTLRVALPNIPFPNFELSETGNQFILQHRNATGFAPVITGILRAMADDYGALVSIEHVVERLRGQPLEKFQIEVHDLSLAF